MHLLAQFELTLKNDKSSNKDFTLKVDFETYDRRTIIFGPSGSGKSLTLQAIAGLIKPNRGHINLNDQCLFESKRRISIPARGRRVGYVFQDYALFPHLTVLENAGYALKQWPLPLSKHDKMRIFDMLDLLGITNLANHFPHELSGGQRQRVAIIRALLHDPHILLLDEPFSAMDMMLREKMREELIILQKRFGIPLLMITHDLEDVKMLAETLIIYQHGTVATTLSYSELKTQYGLEEAWKKLYTECKNVFEKNEPN